VSGVVALALFRQIHPDHPCGSCWSPTTTRRSPSTNCADRPAQQGRHHRYGARGPREGDAQRGTALLTRAGTSKSAR
jgi:hypothetical protein